MPTIYRNAVTKIRRMREPTNANNLFFRPVMDYALPSVELAE
jgi:hypothetical protein